jgi:hypothetical protein
VGEQDWASETLSYARGACSVRIFLVEKVRVVARTRQETTLHIFHSLSKLLTPLAALLNLFYNFISHQAASFQTNNTNTAIHTRSLTAGPPHDIPRFRTTHSAAMRSVAHTAEEMLPVAAVATGSCCIGICIGTCCTSGDRTSEYLE